ncbi:MAG: hypothetical protein ABSA76_16395, partial [Bacteroidales bacterium]
LFVKGLTKIPFAYQAAELMMYPEPYNPDSSSKDIRFWMRVFHFEERYWSIDQLLNDLQIKNILELSSGFSFRGLEYAKQKGFHYIDTYLPDVIKLKCDLISKLKTDNIPAKGKLELLPLNALDERAFNEIITHFPPGKIGIVNEGLLMYLDLDKKKKLCTIIHKILKRRGGFWINADIYIKNPPENSTVNIDFNQKFYKETKIEENKFDDFESAKSFFNQNGFVIDKEAETNYSKLNSLKYLSDCRRDTMTAKRRNVNKIRSTWRLKINN